MLLHRPGAELKRLTPRNNDALLFDGIPWVDRAQEEHDEFADALRTRGVEVLYLTDLLTETLAIDAARADVTAAVLAHPRLGGSMCGHVRSLLADLGPAELVGVLTAGLRRDELGAATGLAAALMDPLDFVIDPLPNLLFTRDSSVWLRDAVAVTSLALPARVRESSLTSAIYDHHPAVREHLARVRAAARAARGRRRPAARRLAWSPSAPASEPRRLGPSGSRRRSSRPASRTPCSSCRSRRTARRCTSTPSAPWSTPMRS